MPSIFRKLRAMLVMATIWSAGWAPLGIVWSAVAWLDAQRSVGRAWLVPFPPIVAPMIMCAAWGFIAGAVFALALASAERTRGTLRGLSRKRTALWGVLGGAVLPALTLLSVSSWVSAQPTIFLTFSGLSMVLGAASAVGGVIVAQRAEIAAGQARSVPELSVAASQ